MNRKVISASVFCLFFVLAILIWTTNKGYDLTDNGYYLISALYPQDIKVSMSSFGLYVNLLSKLNHSMIFLRVSSILLNLISVSFLVYAFLNFFINLKIKSPLFSQNSASPNGVSPNGVSPNGVSPNGVSPNGVEPNGVPISLFICVVSFVFIFSCFQFKIPLDLNYNSLSAYFSYLLLGSLFIALKKIEEAKSIKVILTIIGFIIANIFFIKFTTGILLFIVFTLFICIYLSSLNPRCFCPGLCQRYKKFFSCTSMYTSSYFLNLFRIQKSNTSSIYQSGKQQNVLASVGLPHSISLRDRYTLLSWQSALMFLILGLIIGSGVFFLVLQSPHEWFLSIIYWFAYNKLLLAATHGPQLIWQYCKSLCKMFSVSFILSIILIIAAHFVVRVFKSGKYIGSLKVIANCLYGILFIYGMIFLPFTHTNGNVALSTTYFLMVEFFVTIYLIFIYDKNKYIQYIPLTSGSPIHEALKIKMICLLLFILPFCISFGTDNNIATHIIYELAPWGILAVILYNMLEFKIKQSKYSIIPIVLIACVMFKTLVLSILFEPYRLFDSYFQQNVATNINNNTLLLDKQMSHIIGDVKDKLINCGFKDGDYIIPLYNYSGLIFAVNGRIPNCAWYTGGASGSLKAAEYCINLDATIEVNQAYVFAIQAIIILLAYLSSLCYDRAIVVAENDFESLALTKICIISGIFRAV